MSDSRRDPAAEPHYNPAGQRALAYRLATQPDLLSAMLSRLSSERPGSAAASESGAGTGPLASLTTRSTSDLSIALLDAWATALDVLHFYQERIANEGFLRTATEQRSLTELAGALGWQPGRGVAASTYLAFTVDDSPQSPGVAAIPQGTRVQGSPAMGQRPPTFETCGELVARADWNQLRARGGLPPNLELYSPGSNQQALRLWDPEGGWRSLSHLYLRGVATRLQAGDWLLLEVCTAGGDAVSPPAALPVQVVRVQPDPDADRTRIDLDLRSPGSIQPAPPPPPGVLGISDRDLDPASAPGRLMAARWLEQELSAQVGLAGWDPAELMRRIAALRTQPASQIRVWALRQAISCFGQSAPPWKTVPKSSEGLASDGSPDWNAAEGGTGRSVWSDSWGSLYSDRYSGADLMLDRVSKELLPGSWVVLQSGSGRTCAMQVLQAGPQSVSGYNLTARVTGLALQVADLRETRALGPLTKSSAFGDFKVFTSTVLGQSELLSLSDYPIAEPVAPDSPLALGTMTLGLAAGQPVILSGEPLDLPGASRSEVAVLAEISHYQGYTWLRFLSPLAHSYVRASLRLVANVAAATHGETHPPEVLGSGDRSQKNQRFALQGVPLTYVSAATAGGSAAALEVRVDDVLWEQVPSLYGQPPGRPCYEVRQSPDGDGRTVIAFGDGVNGARLPTGKDNIIALYRVGLGLQGQAAAGALTLLPARPPFVKAVTNPLATAGAAAADSAEAVRKKAPLASRVLDRVVSLRDYEDLARTFAGIAKARAVLRRQGGRPLVHLTVAGAEGADVPADSQLYRNLVLALRQAGDPDVVLVVQSYRRRLFVLRAQLAVEPRYLAAAVLADAAAALASAYSFESRDFGQPVVAAELVATLQQCQGVRAVALIDLRADSPAQAPPLFPGSGPAPVPPALLSAESAGSAGQAGVLPLGLLLLHPAGVQLEVMP